MTVQVAALAALIAVTAPAHGLEVEGARDGHGRELEHAQQALPASSPFSGTLGGEERVGPADATALPAAVLRRVTPRVDVVEGPSPPGVVVGTYVENGRAGRYTWVVQPTVSTSASRRQKNDEISGVPAELPPVISPELAAVLDQATPDEMVRIIVRLKDDLKSPLSRRDYTRFTGLEPSAASMRGDHETLVATRQDEAQSLQENVVDWLAAHGMPASGFWLVNGLSTTVPAWIVPMLAAHPDVRSVKFDAPLSVTGSTTWDGENAKSASGLNAGIFIRNGYTGERDNPITGRNVTIAVLDFFFNATHPVFRDSFRGPSRVRSTWTCSNGNPCTAGLPAVPSGVDVHGSWAASAAAADAMDRQISGTNSFRLDRTGVAEEAELIFISTGAIADTIRGLEKAVALRADIVSESFGGADAVCDGNNDMWDEAVYAAHLAGVLVVGSAGNNDTAPPRTGACTLTGLAEVPSQFVVGGTNDPGSGAYSSVGTYASGNRRSSRGGVNVVINGVTFNEAFTGVSVVAPAWWQFAADTGSGFTAVNGTSFAAPQVAGAAALFKDWMIGLGFASFANSPGVIFANLLAMSDRADSATTYRTSGFDPLWGGGRFQMRYYLQAEHPSGLWRWETAKYTIGHGQRIQHLVGGVGNEPAGIQRFKTYAVFFERDGSNVADIDLYVFDRGCGAGRSLLGSDLSRDSKSMVALDSAAAGKDLCVELHGFHVPPGQTREVVLVVYYTDQTAMR